MRRAVGIALLVLFLLACAWATPGIFEGKIFVPSHARLPQGWIFVESSRGQMRKVEISRAQVVYGDSVPSAQRSAPAAQALVHGTRVRVTAEQDGAGEWRALRVEILRISPARLHHAAWGVSRDSRK